MYSIAPTIGFKQRSTWVNRAVHGSYHFIIEQEDDACIMYIYKYTCMEVSSGPRHHLRIEHICSLYDLKHHIVEISGHVTDVGQGNILLFIDVINKQY